MNKCSQFWQYLATFFLEWEMFWTNVVEKIKTHIRCSFPFSRESWRLWDNVERYSGARGVTWLHTMAHTCCMLDKQGHTRAQACKRPNARSIPPPPLTDKYKIFIPLSLQQFWTKGHVRSILDFVGQSLCKSPPIRCGCFGKEMNLLPPPLQSNEITSVVHSVF
jgi:hypothetical protein